MKHNKFPFRRTLSAVILLLVSTLSWGYDFRVDGIFYNVNEDGISVEVTCNTWYAPSYSSDIIIPSTVIYNDKAYAVTGIGSSAFHNCTSLTSISLPDGLTGIGDDAFSNCTSLASISVPDGVTSIESSVFEGCTSLVYISLPAGLTSIGSGAFEGCTSLASIFIPDGVTSIRYGAFERCTSLASISIPKSVTEIRGRAFCGCSSLASMTVSAGNSAYDSREGCNAIIETLTNTLVAGCQNTVIPSSVTGIGENAFEGCTSLVSISVPDGVTSIGDCVFRDCSSLVSIDLPNGVTGIGEYTFYNCTSLTSISLPKSVTYIGGYAFSGCRSLASIFIPDGVMAIGYNAFESCSSLVSIDLPKDLSYIGVYAFAGCSILTTVICRAPKVPELQGTVFIFPYVNESILYVPSSSIEAYNAATTWKDFGTILPLEEYETGIDSPASTQDNDAGASPYYTPSGQRVAATTRGGIYIHNGKKMMLK